MDTFDIRKYITENRINEAPFKNKVDSLLAYYEAETGNEPEEGVQAEIVHLLSKGYDTDKIKPIIIDIEPLKEEKDVIEPDQDAFDAEKERDGELPVPDEDGNVDDEESEDIPFEDRDAYVIKFVSAITNENIYIPFRAKQAKKNGYSDFDSAVEEIAKYTSNNKEFYYDDDGDIESVTVNVPFWVDSFGVVSSKRSEEAEESSDVVEWIEYADQAPAENSGVSNWVSHMLKSFNAAKEKDSFLFQKYIE